MALPTSATPVAKSLHTLTVLQQIARLIHRAGYAENITDALNVAMTELGLAGRPDPYGLAARALALLLAGAGE